MVYQQNQKSIINGQDGVNIDNATNKQYIITGDDYGKVLNVTAKYVDNGGFNEDLVSTNTSLVVDTLGVVTITGVGSVNTEVVASLTDPELNQSQVISGSGLPIQIYQQGMILMLRQINY